ncbi:Ser/Thr protein phosphatase family protein [Synechococcus sp. PCC 7335]|uniref:purple acid phosphatase family protein n=1 Tax=Synechococcus sp. (strain ATCC 29403 / PCC 7335) TaxID=91464 RepID=UPI00017EC39B|nr:metallophosphoesterase family protein [Synechococcus sp. PCC 7335]EDX87097.1 Ser/Thr protein phosphatase family protein [Synechococcus sp. PCC 7335]
MDVATAKQVAQLPIDSTQLPQQMPTPPELLSDPFLQMPTASSVQVVWFTEFEGTQHFVEYDRSNRTDAVTTLLSRAYEDSASQVGQTYAELTHRDIWRHEATVKDLAQNKRTRYRVTSIPTDGQAVRSDFFTLSPAPTVGQPSKILLTSDHQLKPLVPANLQKVKETVGQVDGVFFAGDLVNVPDRASEWFDGAKGLSFFPNLQGRTRYELTQGDRATVYEGGEIIQHAPLFPVIGNHEVMGRVSTDPLNQQFSNTLPRELVSQFYPTPKDVEELDWVKDHSYNTRTYEEIFSLPTTQLPTGEKTQKYYAVSFGDVRLVSLYVTQIWRSPSLEQNTKGRYRERVADLDSPEKWGYGQHIFEDIRQGSVQYQWLQQELASDAFQTAKYKIVMMHHPPHTLGGNIVPAFTDPVMVKNVTEEGRLRSVQYEYPIEKDYIVHDLLPLLEEAGVQLVFYGHSHLWNRFVSPTGMHFLETSNVGNSYGAHLTGNSRAVPTDEAVDVAGDLTPFQSVYKATGNPNGLTPVVPTLAPLRNEAGNPLPYIASNDITCFTIFETESGLLSSYYFDTRQPGAEVVKFDEFRLTPRNEQGLLE